MFPALYLAARLPSSGCSWKNDGWKCDETLGAFLDDFQTARVPSGHRGDVLVTDREDELRLDIVYRQVICAGHWVTHYLCQVRRDHLRDGGGFEFPRSRRRFLVLQGVSSAALDPFLPPT